MRRRRAEDGIGREVVALVVMTAMACLLVGLSRHRPAGGVQVKVAVGALFDATWLSLRACPKSATFGATNAVMIAIEIRLVRCRCRFMIINAISRSGYIPTNYAEEHRNPYQKEKDLRTVGPLD